MLTLKEFITKTAKNQHFCIVGENQELPYYRSYQKIHCPQYVCDYSRNDDEKGVDVEYCDNAKQNIIDLETKRFLELYGKYEVYKIEPYTLEFDDKTFNCLKAFITEPKFGKDAGPCLLCPRAIEKEGNYIADICDCRCNNCIHGPNNLIHYIDNFDIYHLMKNGDEILKLTLDRTLNQITIETEKEVYSGPVDLIRFKEDVK